jgi:hypothetical protein
MIAASIAFLLRPFHWFSETAADPLWRWPLFVLVVSASALITYPIENVWKRHKEIKNRHNLEQQEQQQKYQLEQQRLEQLSEKILRMTPGEKHVLRGFISANSRTVEMNTSPDAASLTEGGFLMQLGVHNLGFGYYRITDDLWKHLQGHPERLS